MQVKLIVVEGQARQRETVLELPAVIGRSRGADVTIGDPQVSREHCHLFVSDGVLVIRDNDSLNGTIVDGQRIAEAVVKPGARITVGPLTFVAIYEPTGDVDTAAAAKGGPAGPAAAEGDFAAWAAGAEEDDGDDAEAEFFDDVEVDDATTQGDAARDESNAGDSGPVLPPAADEVVTATVDDEPTTSDDPFDFAPLDGIGAKPAASVDPNESLDEVDDEPGEGDDGEDQTLAAPQPVAVPAGKDVPIAEVIAPTPAAPDKGESDDADDEESEDAEDDDEEDVVDDDDELGDFLKGLH